MADIHPIYQTFGLVFVVHRITDHFTHKSEEQGELIIVGGSEHLIRTNSDLKCSDKVSYYEKTVKIEYRHEE